MYKIMLADDEGIVIESLKFIIEKEFPGQCEIESAKTGRQVIETADNFRPDIAFMDIQMPGINGIEAMKEIRQNNKHILFIVLTAFDKFDYAKESVNLGVMEYLNKPIDRKKIVEVLRNAMRQTDQNKEKRSADLKIKEKLETVVPVIENGFINNLLFQECFDVDIDNYKRLLDIEEENCFFGTLMFGEQQIGSRMTNVVGTSVKMQNSYMEVREILKQYFPCIVGSVMSNRIAVLIPTDKKNLTYDERIEMIDHAREMVRKLKSRMQLSFRFGIGRVSSIKDAGKSYHDALKALQQAEGSVVHVEDLPAPCEYEDNYPADTEKELFAQIEKGNIEEVRTLTNSFFSWMSENHEANASDIALKVLEFVIRAESIAYESTSKTYHFNSRQNYLPWIMENMNNYEVLRNWFLEKTVQAATEISNNKSNQFTNIIERAKQYIMDNFQKDVTLDDVSREINISPYYFSKIFKEETGENFIEYVTHLRIEKAKNYLETTNLSMKEICGEIGYADPNYFSRIFKKWEGVTPTEYKEKHE